MKRFNFNQLNIQLLNDFNGTTVCKNYNAIHYQFTIKDKRGIYDLEMPLHNAPMLQSNNKDKCVYNINDNCKLFFNW